MQTVNHAAIIGYFILNDIFQPLAVIMTTGFAHWICKFPTISCHHVSASAKQHISNKTTM